MPITTGTFPKAMQGGSMKRATQKLQQGLTSAAAIMKADKKADAAMTPAMIRKDIAADKKNLAAKTASKRK